MTVRPIRLPDVPAIARTVVAAWQAAYRGILSDAYLDGLDVNSVGQAFTRLVETPERITLVVEVDGVVVGSVGFGAARDEDMDPAQVAEIYAIYVHPVRWRKGAGSALMEAALDRIRQDGYSQVVLWTMRDNARARSFYERMGFHRDGMTQVNERQGETFIEVRFGRKV